MLNTDSISIIVVTWNGCEYTKYCLESIRKYTDHPYNLIVVDNGSSDGTLEFLRSQIGVHVIANKENVGYGRAINQGFELSSSRHVCIMNNDVVVSPQWLGKMAKILEDDPNLGLLGTLKPEGRCLHPANNLNTREILKNVKETKGLQPEEQLNKFCKPYNYLDFCNEATVKNNFGLEIIQCPPSFVSTCCVLVNRDIIQKVGGLADEKFPLYGSEDVDLSWRIAEGGHKVAQTSDVYIHHFKHVSSDVTNLDRETLIKKSNQIFFEKWKTTINRFLNEKHMQGVDIRQKLVENNAEYWFLSRVEKNVGSDLFWQGLDDPHGGRERRP